MDSNIIKFPESPKNTENKQDVDRVLAQDPFYEFILGLITAVDSAGLPLDESPNKKAKELYAKYQRENLIAQWKRELEEEMTSKQAEKANQDKDKNELEN